MRVDVRVAQLVRNSVQEEVSSLSVKVDGEVLEDVHMCRVSDGRHWQCVAFLANVRDRLRADVEYEGVDERDVVAESSVARRLQIESQFRQERHRRTRLQVRVEILHTQKYNVALTSTSLHTRICQQPT